MSMRDWVLIAFLIIGIVYIFVWILSEWYFDHHEKVVHRRLFHKNGTCSVNPNCRCLKRK